MNSKTNYSIELYKEKVKKPRFNNLNELVYASNEYAETFLLTDKIFKDINSRLTKSNYIMDKEIFDSLNSLKEYTEYMYFLNKKMYQLNMITYKTNNGYVCC